MEILELKTTTTWNGKVTGWHYWQLYGDRKQGLCSQRQTGNNDLERVGD